MKQHSDSGVAFGPECEIKRVSTYRKKQQEGRDSVRDMT